MRHASTPRVFAALIAGCALFFGDAAQAQSGLIGDPENPANSGLIGDPENPANSGLIGDPENPANSGLIGDPENPANSGFIGDPENPGVIADPQNSTTTRPAAPPSATPAYSAPRATFRGAFRSSAELDWRREDAFEDTLVLEQRLQSQVRYRISDTWAATLEAKLRWGMRAPGDADRAPLLTDTERWRGQLRAELGDFYFAGRAGRWLFRVGQQSIVWGSTDITRPADVINPRDFTLGFSTTPGDLRLPIPAFESTLAGDRVAWQFVVVPFFIPHRLNLASGGNAIQPTVDALLGSGAAATLSAIQPGAIDGSLDELLDPLLPQTSLPEQLPGNISAGTRITYSYSGVDVSLGYFAGFDRVPYASLSPELREVLALAAGGVATQDPRLIEATQAVLGQLAAGEAPLASEYRRLHTIEFDGVTYLRSLGVRWELVAQPARTVYTRDLRAVRRPMLTGALGLGYESGTGEFIVTAEPYMQHTFTRASDGPYLLDLDTLFAVAFASQLSLGAFDGTSGKRWEDLSVTIGGLWLPEQGDWVLSPSLDFALNDVLALTLQSTWVLAYGDSPSIGDVFDASDAWSISLERLF
ncbi:MAG: hypothetical protein ACI81R_003826 [Bradymonadia bacterium]|jgi:hypothetical protein